MKKSKFLQKVGDDNNALYYHSLFGNLFLLNKEYISVLESSNLQDPTLNPKIVQDLVDNGYIVDEFTNERDILSQRCKYFLETLKNGKNILSLDLNVSEACNFTCPHCMNARSIMNSKNKLMQWPIAKKAIDEFINLIHKNGTIGEIHFGSAEPLINWTIVKQSILYCKKNAPKIPISINTNLSLLTEEIALFFKENQVYIATSLDGPKQGNDRIRIQKNRGTFDVIMGKIDLLQKIGYPLDGCSIMMNDLNIDYIDEDFILSLKNRGFVGIATDIDLVNNKNCEKEIDFYVNKLISIYKFCKDNGMENFGSWSAIFNNLVNQDEMNILSFCKAKKGSNISVNPIGNIFLCGYSTTKVGNIYDFKSIFSKGGLYYSLIQSILPGTQKKCINCMLEGICNGQCLVTNEFSSESNNRTDFLCEFYKRVTTQLLGLKLAEELNI